MEDLIKKRYKDAYRVSRVLIIVGSVVKCIGVALVVLNIWYFLISNTTNVLSFFIQFCVPIIFFFVAGILISGFAQVLRATLDTAVNSSRILSDDDKTKIILFP